MSTPLTPTQKTSIGKVLDFLTKLLDCYEKNRPSSSSLQDQLKRMRDDVHDLRGLLDEGKIDIERHGDLGRKAKADGDGIHLNDRSSFEMPDDFHLEDCSEGYFGSLWQLIETLLHELYHYRHHTGLWGGVKKLPDFIFGGLALMLESALGDGQRTWLWHEKQAYRYSFSQLGFLRLALAIGCNDCIPCCEQHGREEEQAARRQDPSTTYGG
jgi:hypothetical protein